MKIGGVFSLHGVANGFEIPFFIHEPTKKAVVWFGRQPLFLAQFLENKVKD